jgi:hypothetical protein
MCATRRSSRLLARLLAIAVVALVALAIPTAGVATADGLRATAAAHKGAKGKKATRTARREAARRTARQRRLQRQRSARLAGRRKRRTTADAPAPTDPAPAPTQPAPAPSDPAPAPSDPAPAPAPTPSGALLGWNGFGVGAWPDASWRPYASSSPFNQPVGAAAVHPRSAQIVQKVLSWGGSTPVGNLVAGTVGTTRDYGHPTYWAQPDDPVYTLDWTGGGPGAAIDGHRLRIPSAAQAAAGDDGHLTVVTPDGWEYDFWRVGSKPAGGGTMTFSGGSRIRVDGSGLDGGATAANFGNLAGIIRAQELAAGRIDHALFIVLKCTSASASYGYGAVKPSDGRQSAYVYPAKHGGSSCGTDADNADAPPIGARFKLDMTEAQIAALAAPTWKKAILRALAVYGGYVGDTGGPGFALQFESSATYTSFGWADPLVTFAVQSALRPWSGTYAFNMSSGVDWAGKLRVMAPPAA